MDEETDVKPADLMDRLARAFLFYGRVGFWGQFVLLIAIALLGIYTFSVIGGRARAGNLLAFLGLALPVFTTFWCWSYARFGDSLRDDPSVERAPTAARKAWVGVWTGTVGVVVTVLSLFGTASAMMLVMLANPQIGVQISTATGLASSYTISAIDAVSIMSLLLTLAAELLVVAISLRLVFLAASASREVHI